MERPARCVKPATDDAGRATRRRQRPSESVRRRAAPATRRDALFCPLDGTPLTSAAVRRARRRATIPYLGQEISGHIEIRQLVGIGAMGRVYRAFQRASIATSR